MAFLYRSDMHRIQAFVTGVNLPKSFVWDSFEGGGGAADNSYYFAGNMAPAIPAGGHVTPTTLTLTVGWRSDVYPFYIALYNAMLVNQPASVSVTPLTGAGKALVKPLVWTGLLTTVTPPNQTAASSTVGYLTCEIAPQTGVSSN